MKECLVGLTSLQTDLAPSFFSTECMRDRGRRQVREETVSLGWIANLSVELRGGKAERRKKPNSTLQASEAARETVRLGGSMGGVGTGRRGQGVSSSLFGLGSLRENGVRNGSGRG